MSVRPDVSPEGGEYAGSGLGRPNAADEHRRELLAQLPNQLAALLAEPLGPLGLVGAAGPQARYARDALTADALREFAQQRHDLPEWDFGR